MIRIRVVRLDSLVKSNGERERVFNLENKKSKKKIKLEWDFPNLRDFLNSLNPKKPEVIRMGYRFFRKILIFL